MFNKIGEKIKLIAKVVCWIGIVVCIIYGIFLLDNDNVGAGIIVLLLGSFISWANSCLVYGFGQLIENSDKSAHEGEKDFLDNK